MAGENSFIKVLDKVELAKRSLESEMAYVRRFYKDADFHAAYDAALRLEEMRWSSFFVTLKRKSFDMEDGRKRYNCSIIDLFDRSVAATLNSSHIDSKLQFLHIF